MHRVPAVTHQVRRSSVQALLVASLSSLSLGVLIAFTMSVQAQDTAVVWLLAVTAATASLIAYTAWRQSAQGCLHWDGRRWLWGADASLAPCRLRLVLDWQHTIVVSVSADDKASTWLWLQRDARGGAEWRSLRRAIIASHIAQDQLTETREEPLKVGPQ